MHEDKSFKKYLLLGTVILFTASLTQKAYCTASACSDSVMVFLLGWAALLSGGAGFCWLANPLLIAAWVMLRRNLRSAMFLSMFAALLALSFLLFDTVLDNENGQNQTINTYRLGYWLWVGSSVIMLAGTFVLMLRHNTRQASAKRNSRMLNQ